MIDRIIEMKDYRFYCHEQIRTELARHNIGDSPRWLEDKIKAGILEFTVTGTIWKTTVMSSAYEKLPIDRRKVADSENKLPIEERKVADTIWKDAIRTPFKL